MPCRGIRGATTVETDTEAAILAATRELLARLMEANGFRVEDVASAFFTATRDLTAAFPATAARQLGWEHVALLDSHEMEVPGALSMCIRVLLHVNTEKRQDQVIHVYLRGAQHLRATAPAIS
ncbi:MAG: chorismate mutase [Chloroflexi bacterium]|nr:chorismate mutase [Chloroflexota bacterium]